MKSRWMTALILAGGIFVWIERAEALSISFLEPISPTGNIDVSVMNLTAVGVISTSPELASLTVGTQTSSSTVLALVALTQPGSMHMEGGGAGVSDLLTLRTFSAPTGAPVGFQVSFQSDGETGIPNPGGLTAVHVETGLEQLLLSGTFSLPVVGSVDLTVRGRSDLDPVPEPATLLLFSTTMAGLGLGARARWRRRRQSY